MFDMKELREARKIATLWAPPEEGRTMPAKARANTHPAKPADDEVFDDFDALVKTAQASFAKAVRKAVAENDAHGIDSPGTIRGKLMVRKAPPKTSTP